MSDPLSEPICLRLPEPVRLAFQRQADEEERPLAQVVRKWIMAHNPPIAENEEKALTGEDCKR